MPGSSSYVLYLKSVPDGKWIMLFEWNVQLRMGCQISEVKLFGIFNPFCLSSYRITLKQKKNDFCQLKTL